jgi:tRNA(fMet)-specific endonuclease VapC
VKYLIDTNICIYIMNKRPAGVIKKFKQFQPGEIGISTITVSELQYGAAKSTYREKNEIRLEEFLFPFEILNYDQAAAKVYVDVRFQLEKRGQPIGLLDLFIAAHAISQDLVLITNNDKEFMRIKRLKIENWTK